MTKWQPIETAPKDGTEVLLFLRVPFDRVEKARWFSPWENWIVGVVPNDHEKDEYYGIGRAVPSHWMPLPEAPTS